MKKFPWDDRKTQVQCVPGAIRLWRTCFPRAIAVDIGTDGENSIVTDADLSLLVGVKDIDASHCLAITDAGLPQLMAGGLERLCMRCCPQISDAGLAHLNGLKWLDIRYGYVEHTHLYKLLLCTSPCDF